MTKNTPDPNRPLNDDDYDELAWGMPMSPSDQAKLKAQREKERQEAQNTPESSTELPDDAKKAFNEAINKQHQAQKELRVAEDLLKKDKKQLQSLQDNQSNIEQEIINQQKEKKAWQERARQGYTEDNVVIDDNSPGWIGRGSVSYTKEQCNDMASAANKQIIERSNNLSKLAEPIQALNQKIKIKQAKFDSKTKALDGSKELVKLTQETLENKQAKLIDDTFKNLKEDHFSAPPKKTAPPTAEVTKESAPQPAVKNSPKASILKRIGRKVANIGSTISQKIFKNAETKFDSFSMPTPSNSPIGNASKVQEPKTK